MATINATDLHFLRNDLEKYAVANGYSVDYTKAVANAALQAIEDWFVLPATQSAISNAINAATSPVTLTVAQKKIIGKVWLDWKSRNT